VSKAVRSTVSLTFQDLKDTTSLYIILTVGVWWFGFFFQLRSTNYKLKICYKIFKHLTSQYLKQTLNISCLAIILSIESSKWKTNKQMKDCWRKHVCIVICFSWIENGLNKTSWKIIAELHFCHFHFNNKYELPI